MESLLSMMKKNRWNRQFSSEKVPAGVVDKILEAGSAAPSGVVNGVHIYVVDAAEKRKAFHQICVETEEEWMLSQPESVQRRITSSPDFDPTLAFLKTAPLLLVISTRPRDPEVPYAVESAFMAVGYMLVMVKGLGLICAPFAPSILHQKDVERLNSILRTPMGESIQVILPIGYAEKPDDLPRDKPAPNVFHNEFGNKYVSGASH
ncbi:nitroreductase family protein [bacterium]|nr:nitroreductase family protein [candidate division CSSED10-310 bacterium]